jgi:hypothetical protein
MFLVLGKTLYNRINDFITAHLKFIKDAEEFIRHANAYMKIQREWRVQMSELSAQLLTAVSNVAQGQSALHTSLGEYFTKVEALVAKLAGNDDADVQAAIDQLTAAAASVNSDGANLQAHLQALADTSGTPAPTEPVPTAPGGDGSTPPADSGSTGSSDSTPPADGSTAPAGDAGSTSDSGSSSDSGSTGDQPAPPADGSQPTDGSQAADA